MSISAAKVAANQANAQLSTGPRSEEGKARSSRNATKHGLFSKQLLVTGEDPAALAMFRESVLRRLSPRDMLELQVVEQYVASSWRLRRIQAAEHEAYLDEAEAMKLELSESLGETGSKDLPQPSVGLLTWRMLQDGSNSTLERLSRHQQRLWNQMQRCLQQLREMQQEQVYEEELHIEALVQNEPTEIEENGNSSGNEDLYHALRREQQVIQRKEELEAEQKALTEGTPAPKAAGPAPKSAA
jgi:hypothetical protein